MSEIIRPSDPPKSTGLNPKKEQPVRSKKRLAGLTLIVFSLLLGWFLLIGFMGWAQGERQREAGQAQALETQKERQIELAQLNIDDSNFELALLRLTWVLEQDPQDRQALSLKKEAEEEMASLLPPLSTPEETATPVPTSLPTPTSGPISSPDDELQRIRRLMAMKDWRNGITAVTNFQFEFPNYERQETDQFLYNAYRELAIDLINGEAVEEGMYYLSLAAQLGDLSQTDIDYETWSELYLQGMAFYGANWDASAYYFRDLCLAAPFFHDSCNTLQEVLILYGEQHVVAQEWCPAEALFLEASQYNFVPELDEKLRQAQEMCLLATPTPTETSPEGTPSTPTGEVVNSLSFSTPTPTPVP